MMTLDTPVRLSNRNLSYASRFETNRLDQSQDLLDLGHIASVTGLFLLYKAAKCCHPYARLTLDMHVQITSGTR